MPALSDLGGWLVIGLFFVNIMGLAHLGQTIEDNADHGCLLFIVLCLGLMTFAGIPWLMYVGIRSAIREIR